METLAAPLVLPTHLPRRGAAEVSLLEVQSCRILVIDDEPPNVRLLERLLARAGFENFISTTNSREAAALFTEFQPDLVLTDWLMPDLDGCAVIAQLRELMATDDYLPMVVLTADITTQTRRRALDAGATDFLTKPFEQIEVLLRIKNLLKARLSHVAVQQQNERLEVSVRLRTIELEETLTALRYSQAQLIQQERLAALGTMASGIAHDFNNALSVILGFAEVLLRDAEEGITKENATPSITTIITAAEDAAKIVSRLSEFHRPAESREMLAPVNLNLLIEQAVLFTRPRWQGAGQGRAISVSTELEGVSLIHGDAAEMREMLTNLIFNAIDAMPSGGGLVIQTEPDDELVILRLTDTGTGMNETVRQRCLEPFFTTKGRSGTGLGLAMVFGIVQRHGGTIEIESALGRGTTFVIRLPRARDPNLTAESVSPRLTAPLRILLVDDQPILCDLLREHLVADFHSVEIALSGCEALEKFRAAPFDLVITDQNMGEMTGEQLAIAAKELNPAIPVLLLTGYGTLAPSGEAYSGLIDLVVGKPVTQAALRQAVMKVIARK